MHRSDHALATHLSCPICSKTIRMDGDEQQPIDVGRIFFDNMKNLRFVKILFVGHQS
jgi:predicted nucleic acid-binding Zn ribbon protein